MGRRLVISRGEVWLTTLSPSVGREIRKARPALVVSPDAMNRDVETVLVVPMTTKAAPKPYRIEIEYEGREGRLLVDQTRNVDKSRLVKRLTDVDHVVLLRTLAILRETFEI